MWNDSSVAWWGLMVLTVCGIAGTFQETVNAENVDLQTSGPKIHTQELVHIRQTRGDKLVTDEGLHITELVNYVCLCGLIGLGGMTANIINLIVFYRQGLDNTINISLFALGVSDLCSLILQQCFNILINPLNENLDLNVVTSEIQFLIASVPRECFARITCLITVYVTAERCLCITFPLHVKQMITPKRTTTIMLCIYSLTIITVSPMYFIMYIDWKFYPNKNRTRLGLATSRHSEIVERIVMVIQAFIGGVAFLAVILLTIILVRKLGSKSSWRQTVSGIQQTPDSISSRDRKTMNMIVLISVILIFCYTPSVLLFLMNFIVPEFSITGKYSNIFLVTWSFAYLFETINSSVNIFLYLKMSTKYRETFQSLFPKRCYAMVQP